MSIIQRQETKDPLIENLLREVGTFQLEGYRSLQPGGVAVKEDQGHGVSVVTHYDEETERRVHAFIEKEFPGDSFLGEEHGNVRRDPSRYWILDPIDGTSNFTQGIPFWGPSLAFWDAGGPARAWIHLPALGQMFHAERGRGAFLDGAPIRSSRVSEYSNLCTVATVSRMHRRFRLTCPAKHRILGSIVANLAYLASGTFAAMYCRGSLWDIAAGTRLWAAAEGLKVATEAKDSSGDTHLIDFCIINAIYWGPRRTPVCVPKAAPRCWPTAVAERSSWWTSA